MVGKSGQMSTLPTALPDRYERGFTWRMDLRSKAARDMIASLAALSGHLGGEQEISVTQLWLCERAAFLERRLRDYESAVLTGQARTMTEGEYANLLGQFTGLCKTLGLRRTAKRVPTLAERLAAEAQP